MPTVLGPTPRKCVVACSVLLLCGGCGSDESPPEPDAVPAYVERGDDAFAWCWAEDFPYSTNYSTAGARLGRLRSSATGVA